MKFHSQSKRILSLVMAVCLMLTAFGNTVSAASSEDGFTYEALNGTYCTVTGYTGTDTDVVIPSELGGYIVQQISDDAFAGNTAIERVTFPATIEQTGSGIFSGCTSLTYVAFGGSLTSIENSTFRDCTSLTEFTVPAGITSIGSYAFDGCTGLREISFPDTLTEIDHYAFSGCTGLESIDLPDSVTVISGYAFRGCENLASVKLPLSWQNVSTGSYSDRSPFYDCESLTEITIPDGMTRLPDYAFYNCASLKKIHFPESLAEIGAFAFSRCTGLEEVSFSEGLASIGNSAFDSCTSLARVTFPDSLTTIENSAFSGCTALDNVALPEQVTVLNSSVFYGCTSLSEISLPETLTSIGYYAFYGCTGLSQIHIPDSVSALSGYAFRGCDSLESVNIPLSWNSTGSSYSDRSPFYDCESLTEITIPDGMTSIPDYAFYNCGSLNTVHFSDTLTEIGTYAFENCTGLRQLTLPDSLTTIGTGAFSGCTGLSSVTIPGQVTEIQSYVFSDCTGLREVILPETLTAVYPYAFSGCSGLREISIPDSVNTLSGYAFRNCTNLTSVSLPASWSTVGNNYWNSPFAGCTSLREITLPDGMTRIPDYAFYNCAALETAILSDSITEIGSSAFDSCSSLAQIWVPESVISIQNRAFYNCSALTIHGVSGSFAEQYAQSAGFPFSAETLVYETAALSGQVTDPEGNGISGVLVSLYDETRSQMFSSVAATDSDGSWSWPDAIVGDRYSVSFLHPWYQIPDILDVTAAAGGTSAGKAVGEKIMEETATPASDFTYRVLNGTYCAITGYTGSDAEIVLPSEIDGYIVQEIADSAFEKNETLEKVILPETLERVGSGIFSGCTGLTYVGFGSRLTEIGNSMFSGCTSLEKISLPMGITSIKNHAFYNCTSLTEISLPRTLKSIDYYAFYNCTGLQSIELPDSVTAISGYAFRNCTALTSVELPLSWETLQAGSSSYSDRSPFVGCSALTTIALPDGMTRLPDYAFADCSQLESVILPGSLTEIGSSAFHGCTALGQISLPETLSVIGSSAFDGCSALTDIYIPGQVTEIQAYTFSGCTSLSEITLPEELTTIHYYAFSGCTGLPQIHIPDSVSVLSGYAFRNCTALTSVDLPLSWVSTGSTYGDRSPFAGCVSLTEIAIPEGMIRIPDYAFTGCSFLKTATMPDSLTEIGSYAFSGCSGLAGIELSGSLASIGNNSFENCTGLRSISLPASLTSIGDSAFYGCSGLSSVSIPDQVTELSSYLFSGCTGLTQISLPETLTRIRHYAFNGCTGLSEIVIPDSVTAISGYAFRNCSNLTSVSLPVSWNTVDTGSYSSRSPFAGCTKLTELTLPEGLVSVPDYAFTDCTSLETVILPDSLTGIGRYSFDSCTGLRRVWIPESVTNAGNGAFQDCGALTIHGIAGSFAEEYAASCGIPFSTEMLVFETAPLSGRVTDTDGTPIADVAVSFYDVTGKNVAASAAVTDENGYWSYAKAYVGSEYIISFYHPYYQIPDTEHILVSSEGTDAGTVSGARVMDETVTPAGDFTYEVLNGSYCAVTGYTGSDREIVIPSEIDGYIVQEISANAFRNNQTLEKVILPETLERTGSGIFSGCTALTYVGFGNRLTAVESSMFSGCTRLSEITIPAGITSIGSSAFSGCSGLVTVNLPESLDSIHYYAFYNCTALTRIVLPDMLKSVSGYAFRGCTSLSSVVLPAAWETVDTGTYGDRSPFADCPSLTEIQLPDGMTRVPDYAFSGLASLERVVFPASISEIGSRAFNGCSGLTSVTLPEQTAKLDSYAFSDCTALQEIRLPESLTQIESGAFYGCTALTSVAVPGQVALLDSYLFSGCTSLKEVVLPESLTEIDYNAFNGCTALSEIVIPDSVTAISGYAFRNCTALTSVTLPASWETVSTGTYSDRSPFAGCAALTELTIPSGMESIPDYAFADCTSLEQIQLPEGLTKIGNDSFSGCSALREIHLPESLTQIENGAFNSCTALTSVTLPGQITKLNPYVFSGCTALKEAVLPETLTEIDYYAFNGCTALPEIVIPDSVTAISGYAFRECSALTSVTLPVSWETVGTGSYSDRSPFADCTRLTQVTFPDGMTRIPDYAFSNCVSLEKVIFPEGLTEIGADAFQGCTKLDSLDFPASLEVIGSSAFENCTGLRLLNFNESLQSIGPYAFSGCDGLVSMVLNENLQTLSNYAFSDCDNLTAARVPKSVTSFGADSFRNCPKITIYCYSGSAAHMALEGTSYQYYLLDEHEHIYETSVETEATCTRGGSQIRTCTVCGYNYIEMIEPLGHSYTEAVTAPTCTETGYTTHTCSRCGDSYRDSYTPATGHSYGEWITDREPGCTSSGSMHRICSVCQDRETQSIPAAGHTYGSWIIDKAATVLEEGLRHRSCSRCNYTETETIDRIVVDINTNPEYGLANFTVVNAQTLEPISGASIFVSTEHDGENTFYTDDSGKVSAVLPTGTLNISAYADGCLTRNLEITISSGTNEIPQIGLSDQPTYTVEIDHHLMTKDEIEEAGISMSGNSHVYKYELKLEFEPEIDWYSLFYYMGDTGSILGGGGTAYYQGGGGGGTGEGDGDGGGGSSRPIIWLPGDSGGSGGGGRFYIPGGDGETSTSIYPVSEYFYLIIRGDVRWLKEMFDVEMLVVNNSMTDTLEDLNATLNLPEGLSLAKMNGEQQTLAQEIGDLGGGESKSVHWYVRGDSAGSYSVSARLQGTVMPFHEPIDDYFSAENQLQVWAGNALHLHFEFPNAAYHGEDYPITITLTNVSDITLYNISHKVQIEQGMETYYSDGTHKERVETSDWISSGVISEFHPGDQIVIETSVNIFFESEIMERKLESMIGKITGAEQFLEGMKAVQAGIDATDALIDCVTGCSNALDHFDFDLSTESDAKLELFKQLQSRISDLTLSYSTSGNKTIDAAVKLANSGVSATLNAITEDPDEWLKNHSEDDIRDLLSKTSSLEATIVSTGESSRKFNIFDSIRTAISAIPIRFALKNVIMTEDDSNTTSIPWSYSVSQASAQYFGVSNVSKYIVANMIAFAGEAYEETMPSYLQLIPGLDDPFNKDEAIQYIQATEDQIAQIKAKDATGDVTFRVELIRNNERQSLSLASADSGNTRDSVFAADDDFIITCDNETAHVDENGVLIFTGDGMISVTPTGMTGGTLCITDSEGNVYTYVISVVEPHTCTPGEREVVIPPTSEYDGFAVKCCDLCGEIMEVESLSAADLCEDHVFGEWKTEAEPTYKEEGLQSRTCTICGTVEYQFTPAKEFDSEAWEALNHLKEELSEMDLTGYTEESVKAVEEALEAAGALTEDASPEQLQAALEALQAAKEGLTADRSGLQTAISQAEAFTERIGYYTADSMTALKNALVAANTMLADPSASPEQLARSTSDLQTAINGLVPFEYDDVSASDWYYDYVHYVYGRQIMTGFDPTTFKPLNTLIRAEFATTLYRMSGSPEVEYSDRFPDVHEDSWFVDPVLWAAENGIVTGYSQGPLAGCFDPATTIQRQQMAVMLFRYANFMGYDTSDRAPFDQYLDAGLVDEYAQEAMEWAVGCGIISGKYNQTQLDPCGSTTRAECATILQRFMERYDPA